MVAVAEKPITQYSKSDFKYVPMIQQRPLDMKFHYYKEDGTLDIIDNYKLITSVDELKEFAKQCEGKIIAVDTETTGLTYLEDKIVGFSISLDAYSGIYVPIRHKIRREEKVKEAKRDENGNILYTKAGKPRQQTVSKYTYFDQPENLPDKECLDILYEIMLNAKCSLLHNSEFDLNMIKAEGYDITKTKTFDTLILPYIYDAEGRKVAGLKEVSKLLGRRAPTFKETVGDDENFQYTIPSESYKYASIDVANTYYVYLNLYPMVKKLLSKYTKTISLENGKPYDIIARDNELIRAFVDYYGHVNIEVDTPVAEAYKKKIEEDLVTYSEKVYSYFDKGIFSLSTGSKEFKSIMEEFHVVTGAFTDKGAISFGKKGIEEFARNMRDLKFILDNWDRVSYDIGGHIDKRADIVNYRLASIIDIYAQPYFIVKPDRSINSVHVTSKTGSYIEKEAFKELLTTLLEKESEKLEILKAIQKIASLNKALNSYIDKLTKVDHCRMKYKLQGTTSGRLASGNGSKNDKKKNHYYIDLNAQNLTKPNPAFYLAEKCEDENDPDNILGYKFTMVSDEYYHEHKDDEDKIIVEGAQPTANIRKCMKAGHQHLYYQAVIDDIDGTEDEKEFYQIKVKENILVVTDDTIVKIGNKEIPVSQAKHKKSVGKHKYRLVEWDDNREVTHYNMYKTVPRLCLSLDYSSQEYIVLADISRDTLMLDNFYKGIDPHTATAYAIWGEENYDKHKRRKAKACIGDDTFVLTNNGYKLPMDLTKEDKLIDFEGNFQTWVKTDDYGKLIKVTFSNGITETFTPDHPVKVWTGSEIVWKKVEELTEKDNVIQYLDNYPELNVGDYTLDYTDKLIHTYKDNKYAFNINTKEFAYLAGLYIGDGNLQTKCTNKKGNSPKGICYCVEPSSLETVLSYIDSLGLKYSNIRLVGKNKQTYRISINNVAWAECINDLFGKTKTKHIDKLLFTTWNKECFKYFIAGMIDSDGTVNQNTFYHYATTVNTITEALSLACSVVGIKTCVRKCYAKYKDTPYPWTKITLYDLPCDLPVLHRNRQLSENGRFSRLGSWNITKEKAQELRSHYSEWGDKHCSQYYKSWTNIIQGRSLLTSNMIKLTNSKLKNFEIKNSMSCLHVISKEETEGHINVIQTENHIYNTACTCSHNCNFLLNYSGTAPTLASNLDIPLEEAKDIVEKYEKAYWECIQWKKQEINKMYRQGGVCYTVFGRPRQFASRLKMADNFDDEKVSDRLVRAVERRVPNHIIQGTCGDILRWDLIKLYRKYFKNRDPHLDFLNTIHDEVNYSVDRREKYILKYARELQDLMKFDILNPKLPIATSIEIGTSYGQCFPFKWSDETRTRLVPKRA